MSELGRPSRFPHHVVWPALLASLFAYLRFGPAAGPACVFRAVTDVPCLSCGGTRAWRALAHLDLPAAFATNPLLAGVGLAAGAYMVGAPVMALLGRRPPSLPSRIPRAASLAALGLAAANWIYLVRAGV